MLALLGTAPGSDGRRDKLMSLWRDDGTSETLHDSWKTSRLYGALEKMLANSDTSSTPGFGKRSREGHDRDSVDSASEWGFRIDRSSTPFAHDAPRVIRSTPSPNTKRPRLSFSDGSQPAPQILFRPQALKLPSQTSQLLDLYFAVTHSWFPVVAKHNILRASYLYASSPLDRKSVV